MIMGANCGLDDYNPQNSFFFNQMLKLFCNSRQQHMEM